MKRLHRISSMAMSGADMPTLLDEALKAMIELHDADYGNVQLCDARTGELRIVMQHGFKEPFLEKFATVDARSESVCAAALTSRSRVVVEDVESDERFTALRAFAREAGFRAVQTTPLLTASGQVLGMISTHFSRPRQFTERELRMTDLYARQAAGVIHRTRAEAALRDSEERLRLALQASGMGTFMWYVDEDRAETDARLVELFGLGPRDELNLSLMLAELIHPDDRQRYRDAVGRATDPTGDGVLREEIRVRRASDGIERWLAITGQATFAGNPPRAVRIAGMTADVTERKSLEVVLRGGQQQQAYLLKLSDALRTLTDPEQIQSQAARVIGEQLGVERALYGEVRNEPDSDWYVVTHDYHAPDATSLVGRYRANDFGTTLFDEMRAGMTLSIADIDTEPRLREAEREAYRATGIRAYVVVPLIKLGRHVALFAVFQSRPREWSAAEIAMIEETAERTWAAVERAQAEAALREADRRKDEFLATLAHELRNPLAPLRNGLQIARLTMPNDSPLQRNVEMMNRQLTHLVRLVDDLLDVGRINSGKLVLRLEPVALRDVLASSMEAVQAVIDARQHELVVDPGDASLTVLGDVDRLAQVFSNLLSNAAKYTDPGGRIELKVAREGADAVVRIIDSGIGIPASELDHVFDLFSQVRSHQGRAEGGLGIGLSLVKRLVALHDGNVTAQSGGLGRGSTFTVRLKLLDEKSGGARASRAGLGAAGGSARRVLVVDDNADAAETMAALLRLLGHEVWIANDGRSALDKVRALGPDAVFLDLGMPGMGGLEVARHLRASVHGESVLLVAVTGHGQPQDRIDTRAAGFDWHLVKPVDVERLSAILEPSPVRH
jgi:PAS domain S-box-containing protein